MSKLTITDKGGYPMFVTDMEVVDGLEVEIEALFEYQPYEQMTRHYPGCDENAEVYEVNLVNGPEICLLPDVQKDLEIEILEAVAEEREPDYAY